MYVEQKALSEAIGLSKPDDLTKYIKF